MFKGRVTLELNEVVRVPNSNSFQIVFDINPWVSSISKMNFSLINLTSANCQQTNLQIIDQQLVITESFNQTITSQTANIFMQFDRTYIISPNFTGKYNLSLSNGG